MAYNSKYTGAELEKKLDAVNDIPNLIDAILLNKNYITEEALKCFMKDYAPSDYSNIPIDNNTIYWENGLLKSKGGTGGGSDNCGCLWELRESKTGGYYLYSKYHVASKYGMSMYIEEATSEDGSGFIPDYVADLPIDNDTIYWSVNSLGNPILKAKVGTGGSEGNNSEFSKLFKGHYDEAGDLIYIEALSDMIVNGGITIYAGNNVDVDSIYDGLPIDNNTIKWIETTNSDGSIIKLLGINPDIDLGGVSTWDELEGKPSWITTSKPKWDYEVDIYNKPNLSIYATLEYVNNEFKKCVTLDTDQTIKGFKDFENGLSIGGLPITKSQDDVIYLDANLVVRGGITMYAEGEVNIPSIIDSLPIASTTAKGIASFDGTYFAVDSNGKVTLLAANVGLNEEELAAYLTEKKYATQSWVYSLGYAHSSDLNALQTKVNDFLEGSDTDTIINKWKELESFLSGLSESDNLATILGTKANQSDLDDTNDVVATKWTQDDTKINNWDNAYKWGNHADVGYALKSYVDNEFKKYVTLADDQTIGGVKTFTNGLKIGTSTINQSQNDVVYIDANLVVRGGITMFGTNSVNVPTIMDAIATDGVNLKVVDGVLTFVGSSGGGLTEVYWDDVIGKPTLLSSFIDDVVDGHYLPISGGTVTGPIYLTYDINGGNIPIAGSMTYGSEGLTAKKTFIGNARNAATELWYNMISVRADNGNQNFGMYIASYMTDYQGNLFWNKQEGYEGAWQGERVILDSVNWRNYVTLGGNPTYDGMLTVNGSDARGSYPALRMHIPNVNWQQFLMRGDGIVELRYGDGGQSGRWGQLALGTLFFDDQRDDVLYFPGKEYFDNHGNLHIPNADGSWSWNIYNSNGSNVMTIYTDGGLVAKKVSADYIILKEQGSETYRFGFIGTSDAYGLYIEAGTTGTQYQGTLKPLFFGWRGGTAGMTLDGSKNLLVYGGITMYSDIRKKTKLQDVELSLKQIADAPLIEHYYNSDSNKTTHVGSIAQYWAGLNDWFCKLDNEGYYTMEIQNAALASAISIARELVKYESKTDRKIRLLKDRVKELEDKIEKLENN